MKALREAGRVAVQRNTFYEPIKVWDESQAAVVAKTEVGGDANEARVLETNLATA